MILQRQVSGGSWSNVQTWSAQTIAASSTSSTYSQGDSYSTLNNDVKINYRVILTNSNFVYKSSQHTAVIVINPTRPFISSMSVVLKKEYWDIGILNPTEEVYLVIGVSNPTASSVTKTVQFERGFTDDPENEVFGDSQSITLASGQSASITFMAASDHSGDYTAYLVPGVMPNVQWIDPLTGKSVNLDTWNWCDLTTGTQLQSQRQIEYGAWLTDNKQQTLTTMDLPVYVPQSKTSNLFELRNVLNDKANLQLVQSILSYGGIIGLVGISIKVMALPTVAILTDAAAGPVGWVLAIAGGTAFILGKVVLPLDIDADTQQIAQLVLSIEDPLESDINKIEPINYMPINTRIQQEILNNSYLMQVYNTFDKFNRMVAVTNARIITQERYVAAVALGDESAAQLQADTLSNYTNIEAQYLNEYLYNIRGIFDDFTIHNMVLNNNSVSMNDVYSVISEAQNYVRQAGGFPSPLKQYFINQGNTSAEIDKMQNQFLTFNVDAIDNNLSTTYSNYNLAASQFFANESNIISGLYDGAYGAKFISRHLNFETKFISSSINQRKTFEVEITPLYQSVYSGSSATSTLQISNSLGTQAITVAITISNVPSGYLTYFNYPSTITIGASGTSTADITINIPDDMPPTVLNPIITISTTISGITFTETKSIIFSILADDLTPPLITIKQFSPPDIFGWHVMINDGDSLKDVATAKYIVTLNGLEISSGPILETDGWIQIAVPFASGVFGLEVFATNNENKYAGEEQNSTASVSFEITLPFMKSYIIEEITQLTNNVISIDGASWAHPASWLKKAMEDELDCLTSLISYNATNAAYDLLLYDIKPKLTGLETYENETAWGCGVDKRSWVVNTTLQSEFKVEIDQLLYNIKAFANLAIGSDLHEIAGLISVLETQISANLHGCRLDTLMRLANRAATLVTTIVQENEKSIAPNQSSIDQLSFYISKIDHLARNSEINGTCSKINAIIDDLSIQSFSWSWYPWWWCMYLRSCSYQDHHGHGWDHEGCGNSGITCPWEFWGPSGWWSFMNGQQQCGGFYRWEFWGLWEW